MYDSLKYSVWYVVVSEDDVSVGWVYYIYKEMQEMMWEKFEEFVWCRIEQEVDVYDKWQWEQV